MFKRVFRLFQIARKLSTSGAIDEESIFYLTSRGVSKREAASMLILAFLDEAIQEIENKRIRLTSFLGGKED